MPWKKQPPSGPPRLRRSETASLGCLPDPPDSISGKMAKRGADVFFYRLENRHLRMQRALPHLDDNPSDEVQTGSLLPFLEPLGGCGGGGLVFLNQVLRNSLVFKDWLGRESNPRHVHAGVLYVLSIVFLWFCVDFFRVFGGVWWAWHPHSFRSGRIFII